jgi:lambda family phage tail tape measure protein
MASNISVAITVDNKQYIANINAADQATQKFANNTEKNLNKVGGTFDTFSKKILGLKTLLAGLTFGAAGRGALQFADELSDLSNATGIAIGQLLSFQQALTYAGGEPAGMAQGITQFTRSIDEAAQGSLKAQNTFAELGISLTDLKKLSEQDLLTKALDGFDNIGNKSREAAVKMDLFGKSFKTVDPRELKSKLDELGNTNDKYAASIEKAAALNDKLAASLNAMRIAFLTVIGPIITMVDSMTDGGKNIDRLVTILKVLGVVLLTIFGGGLIGLIVRFFGTIARGFAAIGPAITQVRTWFASFGVAAESAAMTGAKVFSASSSLMKALRGVGIAVGAIAGAVAGIFGLSGTTPEAPATADTNKKEADTTREVTDALAKRRLEIQQNIVAFKKQSAEIIDNINIENMLIGKSEEYGEIVKAQEAVFKRSADKIDELRQAKALLSKDEAGLAGIYDQQIKKIQEAATVDAARITAAIENQQSLKLIEKDRLQQIQNMTRAMEAQAKIQETLAGARLSIISQGQDTAFAASQIGKGDLQKQMMSITEANRKAGLEASRAFAAAFEDGGDGLTSAQAKQLADGLDAIAAGYKGITQAQLANLEESRTWSAGWEEAYANYKSDAENAAAQSTQYFKTFSTGFEDAFVKMVQTGKLSFKDLANSLIADFARIQAKKALLGIFDMGGADSKGNGFSFGTLFNSIGGLFKAGGGSVQSNSPYIVGERGPELFVPNNAGRVVPNNALGSGGGNNTVNNTAVTYSIQAVDASSFRSLVARDPEFIHNVAEQGRRQLPIRSRR